MEFALYLYLITMVIFFVGTRRLIDKKNPLFFDMMISLLWLPAMFYVVFFTEGKDFE